MLTLKNLSVSGNGAKILENISFDFKAGHTYALLGPNGSGKSTLARAIMGHPDLKCSHASRILFGSKNIKRLAAEERAKLGIFLSFQTPLALAGVSVFSLLRLALEKKMSPLAVREKIKIYARALKIKDELLARALNEDFSGGEKKKLEALQAAILSPRFAIFDEIDTGVDVDALKIIAGFLKKHLPAQTTCVFITHSPRLLSHIKPKEVLVIKDGALVATGKKALAKKIEISGFKDL